MEVSPGLQRGDGLQYVLACILFDVEREIRISVLVVYLGGDPRKQQSK